MDNLIEIKQWKDVDDDSWRNLLLGNGFSIGISDKFHYWTLLDNVKKLGIKMYPHAQEIFEKVDTVNFEEVLRIIYHAYIVNFYNLDAIKSLYLNVRKSLIEAVNASHVTYGGVPALNINTQLRKFRSIYTTNYDLIPYWSVMKSNSDSFCDFFWNKACVFNLSDTNIIGSKSALYYLHGAIHLQESPDGYTFKVTATQETSISEIIDESGFKDTPLFISEGKSEFKLRRIRSNDYLNFCYNRFSKAPGNFVVFGHSLSEDYDAHILSALKENNAEKIAISVFTGMEEKDKSKFINEVQTYFHGSKKEIVFFDSSSHPLGQVKT
ncbi:DUF4917 family protein [Vibrio furnissii]|uniref:DUF4917 family protein n=1 Tax=Vibrio furnissii TaxID=29494 RepID=UPI0001B9310E|nr:DUF4917 family protein [Vibrio furnissii]EEX39681.1 hypothetical protein VFA_002215 [Vibrio furnissii CIP 102972]QDC94424.1 DUF4917 family protein [Vibrio furnissii]UON49866.1 DUF4917 family protein [Vibrio furnissii]SUQ33576.1 Uncharacterised protein [Vibrio furnissii]